MFKKTSVLYACASLALLLVSMSPLAVADEGEREEHESYIGLPPAVLFPVAVDGPSLAPSLGGASEVPVEEGETTVSVIAADDSGRDTLNVLAYHDDEGEPISEHGFCNTIDDHAIPAGAATVSVYVTHNTYFEINEWDTQGCDATVPSLSGLISLFFP